MASMETPARHLHGDTQTPRGASLAAFLRKARWRAAVATAVHGTEPFAIALPVAAALLVFTLMVFHEPWAGLRTALALGAIGLVAAALAGRLLLAFRRECAPRRVSWEIDRRLGLHEAFSTSLEIVRTGGGGFFDDAVVEDTAARIEDAKLRRAFPLSVFWPGWAASGLLTLLVLVLPALAPGRFGTRPPCPPGDPEAFVTVPDVTDRPLDEARSILEERGLAPGSVTEVPALRPGWVVAQSPAAGDSRPCGSLVTLFVGASAGAGDLPQTGGEKASPAKEGASPSPQDDPRSPSPEASPPVETGGEGGEEEGRKPPMLGDPERTPANFEDVQVKPLFGPAGEVKTVEIEIPAPEVKGPDPGPGKGNTPELDMNRMLVRYEKRAEHALDTGRISPEDRKAVLGYFERVRGILGNGRGD